MAARIARATLEGVRHRGTFRAVECFLFFLGYNRSGSTLVGSLLNAHPEMVVAHESDFMRYVRPGISRNALFAMLLLRDRQFAAVDRRFHGYAYSLPDSYQGRFTRLRVIGDKHAGRATRSLHDDPDLLEHLRTRVGVPLRIIHLVRNPFDNIASIAQNRGRPLSFAIRVYQTLGDWVDLITPQLDSAELFEIRYERIIADPVESLHDICRFIGVDATPSYVNACAPLIDGGGRRGRDRLSWSSDDVGMVEDLIASRPCLAGYSFEN
jgi:Sulfotransferase domain